nr:hypothetical protein [Mangrovicoccus ximenensis]
MASQSSTRPASSGPASRGWMIRPTIAAQRMPMPISSTRDTARWKLFSGSLTSVNPVRVTVYPASMKT